MKRGFALVAAAALSTAACQSTGDREEIVDSDIDPEIALTDALVALRAADTGTYEYVSRLEAEGAGIEMRIAARYTDGGSTRQFEMRFDTSEMPADIADQLGGFEIDGFATADGALLRVGDAETSQWIEYDLAEMSAAPELADLVNEIPLLSQLETAEWLDTRLIREGPRIEIDVDVPGEVASTLVNARVRQQLLEGGGDLDGLGGPITIQVTIVDGVPVLATSDISEWVFAAADELGQLDGAVPDGARFLATVQLRDIGQVIELDPVPTPEEPLRVVSVGELEPGDCSAAEEDLDQIPAVPLTDCEEPRRYEVFTALGGDYPETDLDALDARVNADCTEAFREHYDVPIDDTVAELLFVLPPAVDEPICIADRGEVSATWAAPPPFAPPSEVSVSPSRMEPEVADRYRVLADVAASADGEIIVALGTDDAFDPEPETGFNDLAIWTSLDGGVSFQLIVDEALTGVPGNGWGQAIAVVDGTFVATGGQRTPEGSISLAYRSTDGLAWEPIPVELPDAEPFSQLFAIVQTDGETLAVGERQRADGAWTAAIWTVTAAGLVDRVDIGELGQDLTVVDVTTIPDLVLFAYDFAAEHEVAFRRGPFGWVADTSTETAPSPTLQRPNGFTFGIDAGEPRRFAAGRWEPMTLPVHEDGSPGLVTAAASSCETVDDSCRAGVLAVGTMQHPMGVAPAAWFFADGADGFELVWHDIENGGGRSTPAAATAVPGGFVVVGFTDPSYSYGLANDVAAWVISLDP